MKKKTAKQVSLPLGIGIGIITGMVITVIGAMLAAWMIAGEKIGQGSIPYAAILILVIAAAIGAFAATLLIKEKRLIVCLSTGAGYYLCLIGCTALFFGGQYQAMGISALAVFLGSAITILVGVLGKKVAKHKVKIPTYR